MLFYTVGQSYVFLLMLLSGLVCGAWYGILRRLRRLTEAGKPLTALFDVLFAVGCVPVAAFAMYISNGLDLRLYALLGAACGFTIYISAISPISDAFCALTHRIIRNIRNIEFLKKIFLFLLR